MFLVIIKFPPIRSHKDSEFREWFASTNATFANYNGFIRRLLLKPKGGGNYVAIVEHATQDTFMAMHNSPEHKKAAEALVPLLDGHPTPEFYEVVSGE